MIKIINMNSVDWITAEEACNILGVRPATLYAYVSRGLLTARKDVKDARRSLYDAQDVANLRAQHHRPRARREVARTAIGWGEPVLTTAISGLRDGTLWFGDRPAVECAGTMTLEEVAAHHWQAQFAPSVRLDLPHGPTALERAMAVLAQLAGEDEGVSATLAADLVVGLADAMMDKAGQGPLHRRLAEAWKAPAAAEDIRRALVLLSDHELNPSTFAVRVCASTGSGLAACLLTGLATLSGPRHGGVAGRTREALEAAIAGQAETFVATQGDPYGYGLSHPLYPQGDPRARFLMEAWGADDPAMVGATALAEVSGLAPNIDLALAIMSKRHSLPSEAPFVVFALARATGWIAHVSEQRESGAMIRPRAQLTS